MEKWSARGRNNHKDSRAGSEGSKNHERAMLLFTYIALSNINALHIHTHMMTDE